MESDKTVFVPKGLILASYRLSLRGQRLKMIFFSKVPPLAYEIGLNSITVTAKEWKASFSGLRKPYENLKKAAKEMMFCEVQLEGESKKRLFLDSVEYDDANKQVTLIPNWELLEKARTSSNNFQ